LSEIVSSEDSAHQKLFIKICSIGRAIYSAAFLFLNGTLHDLAYSLLSVK